MSEKRESIMMAVGFVVLTGMTLFALHSATKINSKNALLEQTRQIAVNKEKMFCEIVGNNMTNNTNPNIDLCYRVLIRDAEITGIVNVDCPGPIL